jgi:hypothetical protein
MEYHRIIHARLRHARGECGPVLVVSLRISQRVVHRCELDDVSDLLHSLHPGLGWAHDESEDREAEGSLQVLCVGSFDGVQTSQRHSNRRVIHLLNLYNRNPLERSGTIVSRAAILIQEWTTPLACVEYEDCTGVPGFLSIERTEHF